MHLSQRAGPGDGTPIWIRRNQPRYNNEIMDSDFARVGTNDRWACKCPACGEVAEISGTRLREAEMEFGKVQVPFQCCSRIEILQWNLGRGGSGRRPD
jgi:hypothetical protein